MKHPTPTRRRTATLLCLIACTAATWVTATPAVAQQEAKNGCTSPQPYSGALTSPPFATGSDGGTVSFQAWFEVEAVLPTSRDEATVQYDADGFGSWIELGRLNPPEGGGGSPDQGWSNHGLATAPSFQEYTFALPVGATRIRFLFDTGDVLYQGFRGVAVDAVTIVTGGSLDPPPESFEGTTGWTFDGPAGPGAPFWHIAANEQGLAVKSPEINPTLVTLPDSGALPPTAFGSRFAWFGSDVSGTFCGPDYAGVQAAQVIAPDTSGSGPSGLIEDRSPTFTFTSDDLSASFQCSLDGEPFAACSSPHTLSAVSAGAHTLRVRAVSASGVPDPTPASFSFSIAQTLADLPTPELGQNVNVAVASGTVLVSQNGVSFVSLEEARQIPVGSFLDTKRGTVRLVSATGSGSKTQSGRFSKGIFQARQSRKKSAKGLTELRLRGGNFGRCRDAAALASGSLRPGARAAAKKIRSLRGNAKGKFRTRGPNSSATVRGTIWDTIDRCDGTLTKVKRGRVAVRDFGLGRTVIVRAGRSYLARAR